MMRLQPELQKPVYNLADFTRMSWTEMESNLSDTKLILSLTVLQALYRPGQLPNTMPIQLTIST